MADPNGDWELEIHMSEERMGHIAQARQRMQESKQDLPVTFILATSPGFGSESSLSAKLCETNALAANAGAGGSVPPVKTLAIAGQYNVVAIYYIAAVNTLT